MDPHSEWIKVNGDATLRLNYNLNENSIVVDAGGFHGSWAQEIVSRYNPYLFVFEPIKEYYEGILKSFQNNTKIKVYDFGLSNKNFSAEISLLNDSSSIYMSGDNKQTINLKSFYEFVKSSNINKIDLMKINIEGGEYDLLDDLIEKDFVKNIDNLQVQFHRCGCEDYYERRKQIREKLESTHYLTYDYEFIWENWKLK